LHDLALLLADLSLTKPSLSLAPPAPASHLGINISFSLGTHPTTLHHVNKPKLTSGHFSAFDSQIAQRAICASGNAQMHPLMSSPQKSLASPKERKKTIITRRN